MSKRDIYIAIMVAAARGTGLHLSADEVVALSLDDMIATAAVNRLSPDEHEILRQGGRKAWGTIDARKKRVAE